MLCYIILVYFLAFVRTQEIVSSLLLYEDQKDVVFEENGKSFNFLTLKRKMHEERKHFKDVTFCYRFNFLSYIDETRTSNIVFGYRDNYVEVVNPISGTKKMRLIL